MLRYVIVRTVALAIAIGLGGGLVRAEQNSVGYGLREDILFAKRLWAALVKDSWVGPSRRMVPAQVGEAPHGNLQQIAKGNLKVDGRTGRILVKANHRGRNLEPAKIKEYADRYLSGYAVMFRREAGYDRENRDWFWAVFNPDGSLATFKNFAIAGRVDTGQTNGCIGCHRKKGGRDLETLTKE